jgi:hypothetical protein
MSLECADMTRNSFVTALGFGVFAFIWLTLDATPAQAVHLLGNSYSHAQPPQLWQPALMPCDNVSSDANRWTQQLGRVGFGNQAVTVSAWRWAAYGKGASA